MPSLEKLLARNVPCSRKQARRLVTDELADLPSVVPCEALPMAVTVASRTVMLHESFHLVLNKPLGCVTALHDSVHTVAAAYLTGAPLREELRPVGRLDLDTTGLLIWTTDGDWLHRLTHPRSAVPRRYHVALARPFHEPDRPIVLRDGHVADPLSLRLLSRAETHPSLVPSQAALAYAEITLTGGAYHEVRRIFAALGNHVLSLCRVSFGAFELPQDMAPGTWRAVTKQSV